MKSKLVSFHKGRLPKSQNFYQQMPLERVNEFSYLGMTLTSQMCFSSHIKSIAMKANLRVGLLFAKLDLQKMPVEIIRRVFACYILPVFEYGLALWISGTFSSASEQLVNGTLTKFWKRYLNLPLHTNNATIYHLTSSLPLMSILQQLSIQRLGAIYLPSCMNGVQLNFVKKLNAGDYLEALQCIWEKTPSHFWRSRIITRLPANQKLRKKLCREICDTDHYENCKTASFHANIDANCICKYCGQHLHAYHITYNFCNALTQ